MKTIKTVKSSAKKVLAVTMCAFSILSASFVAQSVSPDTFSSPFAVTANAAIANGVYRVGSRGIQVQYLQWTLNALNYNCGNPDGIYGNATKQAVIRFQNYYGLTADGIVGPQTLNKLNSIAYTLQDKLCRSGYQVTKDSILGPNTRKQIGEFNYNHNISGDIATDATWRALDQSISYATPLVNGAVYCITPQCADKVGGCVDESTCSSTVGGNIHLWKYLGNKNQLWVAEYVKDGYYRFRNLGSGLYLCKSGGGNQPSNVVQYSKNYTYSENWKIKNCGGGWFNIVNQAENQYLDVNCCGSSNGTQIHTYWSTNCSAQRFRFTKVNVNGLSGGASTAVSKVSTQRQKMINTAKNELKSGVSGKNNKYTRWYYGYSYSTEWCDIFVSWCARNAGISTSVIPSYAYCPYTQEWFRDRGRSYEYKSNLNIEPGDLITVCTCGDYNRYHRDHIAIVVDVTSTTITTIEGNTSGNNGSSCVATKTYNRSNGTRSGCVISYLLKPNY